MNPVQAIIQRNIRKYLRSKSRVFGTLIMSIFMVVMFSFLMKSVMKGIDTPMNYLIAGVVIMSVFQTSINNSSDILTDIASGYLKEVLVAPVSRTQIAAGQIISSAIISTIQGLVTLIAGLFLGLHVTVIQIILLVCIMFISAVSFSAIGLFLAVVSRNSPSFQTMSSMITMPLTFVSGAYIPTTIMPAFLMPVVYLNPLTYTTSAFRYVALHDTTMTQAELVAQGMAFKLGNFIVTPAMGLGITILIGAFFLWLCVKKFDQADFSSIKVSKGRPGGGPGR
ncbi:ABC transporter permease [uncultured Dubosiella sp.]|uniref:ABC transporter permease n=1 Tax=uncultured Dubosiella sp. TaxID=1937011 RepID=UPI002597B6AF|nr:ABC transporter permease [uncultured Dubosiella sp.]